MSMLVGPRVAKRYGLSLAHMMGKPTRDFNWQRERYYLTGWCPWAKELSGVRVRRAYNFGNFVRQTLNANAFGVERGIRSLSLPPNSWFGEGVLPGMDVIIQNRWSHPGMALAGTYFYPEIVGVAWDPNFRAQQLVSMSRLMPEYLHALDERANSADAVIHLRSGDVFQRDPHPGYAPPPLQYFETALEMLDARRVLVVVQDLKHPYIPRLLAWAENRRGASVQVQSGSLQDDLRSLMSARSLCLSQGTLGLSGAWLSRNVRTVVTYGSLETAELRARGVSVLHVLDRHERDAWTGSQEQIAELLQSGPDDLTVERLA